MPPKKVLSDETKARTNQKRLQTMQENKRNGSVRKQRAPMSEEAISQMVAKRKATIAKRNEPSIDYCEYIHNKNIRKQIFTHMAEIELKNGIVPFSDFVDLLVQTQHIPKGTADTFVCEFIVRNQFVKAECGINQPDPRTAFLWN
jgi:hypothetical protein